MPNNPIFNSKPIKIREVSKSRIIEDPNIGRYSKRDDDGNITPTAENSENSTTPVFLTPQSLASFPGASIAVNLIWIILAEIHRPFSSSRIVPIVAALLIGLFIYSQSATESMTRQEKCRSIFIAFLNSLYLAAVALGLDIGRPPNL